MKSNNKFNKETDFNTEFKTDPMKISYKGKITKDSYAFSSSCLSRLDILLLYLNQILII